MQNHQCVMSVNQAAQQLGRTSGYDPPRLFSLLHLAQWRAILAAGGQNSTYNLPAVAGNSLINHRLVTLAITLPTAHNSNCDAHADMHVHRASDKSDLLDIAQKQLTLQSKIEFAV